MNAVSTSLRAGPHCNETTGNCLSQIQARDEACMQVFTRVWLIFLGSRDDGWGKGFTRGFQKLEGTRCG